MPDVEDVVDIAAGENHTMILDANGMVWTLGENTFGQLGTGDYTSSTTPVQVEGLSNIVSIEAGWRHCIALKDDGSVWAWGQNDSGQLGDNTYEPRPSAQQVPGLLNIASIHAGYWHNFAITDDGSVYVWGDNQMGQLGLGSSFPPTYNSPQTLNLTGVVDIASGYWHSLALLEDGSVYAWGDDSFGQLGLGEVNFAVSPTAVPGLENIAAIACGTSFSAAVNEDGEVWTWGYNASGQLGIASNVNAQSPASVELPLEVVALSCGGQHMLARAVDGTIWGWGKNDAGQVGNGQPGNQPLPVQVVGLCDTPSAIGGVSPDSAGHIYPNPSNGLLTILLPDGLRVERMEIYDSVGQKVNTLRVNQIGGVVSADQFQLPAGLYLICLSGGGYVHQQLWVKD
jgi:alpha-tubulin suppressor-like RCC1 family protein